MAEVKSKNEFKHAVLGGEDEIKVDNPKLEKWLIAIFSIKQVAWGVAIVLVGAAIAVAIKSAGIATPLAVAKMGVATSLIGFSGAKAMISLGVIFGGAKGLKNLRNDYKIISNKPLIIKKL